VSQGLLLDRGRSYHVCICSYAMHVLEHPATLLLSLACCCQALIILSPHKLPR